MARNYWLKLTASFIFITVLPICWIVFELRDAGKGGVEAADGIIDLRGGELASEGKVRLNGEWLLYPGRLPASGTFSETVSPQTVRVPGVWNRMPGLSSGLGTAAYRLRVLLPEGASGIYGIRTTNIRTSSQVYVNGERIGGSGRPGMSREDTVPGNAPYVGYFSLQGSEAEIVVQVANYSYASGGIVYPVWFGTQEAIAFSREYNLFDYWLTASGFLIPSLFLLLFFRLRRREAPLLQLGGFCICSLLYVLTHGEKAALTLLTLDYEWVLRIQLISSGFVYYFLARYVVLLYPAFRLVPLDRTVQAVAAVLGLVGLTLPTALFSRWEALLLGCSLLSIAYVFYVLIRAVWTRGANTLALAASIQSVTIMVAVYLLHGFGRLENHALLPYVIIIFCASQAYLIVARFSDLLGHAERMSKRLLHLDEKKDEFMLNTSYEIREPLQDIANLASARERGDDAGGSEHRLSAIAGIARRLSYLVDDMIDFSLLKTGDAAYRPRSVQLPPVVRSVLELYPPRVLAGWRLEPMPDNLPPLMADERRLGQIVHNLVAYTIQHVRGGAVRLSAQAEDGRVTLAIAAEGVGTAIAAGGEEPKSEFYSADEKAGESADRLRLSVTLQLIGLGGGQWRVSGTADGEETLYVSWPAASAEAAAGKEASGPERAYRESRIDGTNAADERLGAAAASAQARHTEEPDGSGSSVADEDRIGVGSILIVEDDLPGAQVMAHLLGGARVSIRMAAAGTEALELLQDAGAFDLVIVDFVLPDIPGLELVRRIRERFTLSELPILLLREGRWPEEAPAGFRAGANDILVKPYEAAELKARAGTLLQLRSSVRDLVRTETAFLQAQIKPHFLFNALNTIMSVSRLDPPQAEALLLELSRYLRASFDFDNQAQRVPLRSELELVRSYLAIESARFDDRLRAEFDVESDEMILVPPLSIQPLVENAVRHGILRKPEGGTVRIGVKADALGWRVSVEDDGVGIPAGRLQEIGESGGVGLANISRRLRLLYGETLHIESWPGEGTRVDFIIPGDVEHEGDID